jgi:hypothetical protein
MKYISLAIVLGLSATSLMAQPPGPGGPGGGPGGRGPDTNKWNIAKLDASKLPAPAAKTGVTFDADIKPIFEASCFGCHGDKRQRGGFRLDSADAALKGGREGKMIVPGDSAKSLLVMAISQSDPGTTMPPKPRGRGPGGPMGGPGGGPPGAPGAPAGAAPGTDAPATPPPGAQAAGGPPGPGGPGRGPQAKPLTPDQVALVRAWIDQGAK